MYASPTVSIGGSNGTALSKLSFFFGGRWEMMRWREINTFDDERIVMIRSIVYDTNGRKKRRTIANMRESLDLPIGAVEIDIGHAASLSVTRTCWAV